MSGFDTHQYSLLNDKPESSDKQAWITLLEDTVGYR